MGAPVPTDQPGSEEIELYVAFPLDQEQESLALIRGTVVIIGVALTLLVVGIGVLVTRLVVDPVRQAAGTAQVMTTVLRIPVRVSCSWSSGKAK